MGLNDNRTQGEGRMGLVIADLMIKVGWGG